SPIDRLLYGAYLVVAAALDAPLPAMPAEPVAWIAPVCGRPHPLSDTERRFAAALARDDELSRLFSFNQFVDPSRGLRPQVDLLWRAGRLVVELDGYADHGTPSAFRRDRDRDYELAMAGYIVIRLTNDEIAADIERSIEKVRDMVRFRQPFK